MRGSDEVVPLVARRAGILRAVALGGDTRSEVAEAVDVSRSTVDRGIRELAEADLLEGGGDELSPTLAGRLALEAYDEMQAQVEAVAGARALLAPLPPETELPVVMLRKAVLAVAPEEDPLAPVRERLSRADVLRCHRADGADELDLVGLLPGPLSEVSLCLSPGLVEELLVNDRERLRTLLATDSVTVREADGPAEYDLLVLDPGDERATAAVLVRDEDGLRGCLVTDDAEAVEWANEAFERRWGAATELDGP